MTKDDIMKLAEQCQLLSTGNREGIYAHSLVVLANLVALHEREACAKACERDDSMRWSGAAAAIRERSQS